MQSVARTGSHATLTGEDGACWSSRTSAADGAKQLALAYHRFHPRREVVGARHGYLSSSFRKKLTTEIAAHTASLGNRVSTPNPISTWAGKWMLDRDSEVRRSERVPQMIARDSTPSGPMTQPLPIYSKGRVSHVPACPIGPRPDRAWM